MANARLPLLFLWSKMANSSITLAQTMDWAKRFIFLRPQNAGNFNEPALTSANTILQTIIGPPFAWRWNRAVIGFIANVGQQDYTIFNWTALTPVSIGYVLIDSNGNAQQVTTAGTTGASLPTWNATGGGITNDGSAKWTNQGAFPSQNASTSYQFGWIENASIQETDYNSNSCQTAWRQITPQLDLALDSNQARPHSISAQYDNANNSVTFRLMPAPDKAYPVVIQIQQKPSIITSTQSLWSPIPDEYSRLYNWGFLSQMYMYADDPRFQLANQKFITNLLSTAEGLSETQMNIWLNNWQQITGSPIVKVDNISQGRQGRIGL